MKRPITIAALLASMTLAASVSVEQANAQYAFSASQGAVKENVQGRSLMGVPSSAGRTNMVLPEGVKPTTYGTEVSLLKEGFSKMTSGEENKPDTDTKIWLEREEAAGSSEEMTKKYPVWFNVKPEYTETKVWGAGNVYPAGGCLYMAERQAKFNTPLLDVSEGQGNFFVRLRARVSRALQDGEGAVLLVQAAETNNMAPSWTHGENLYITNLTTEWKTYEFLFQNGGKTTLVNIVKEVSDAGIGVLIDDIEVLRVDAFVAMPELKLYVNYKGTSADLRWNEVAGADGYLLNVYHMVETGEAPPDPRMPKPTRPEFVVKDRKIEGGSTVKYTLSDLVSGTVYYYSLTATKGEQKSIASPYAEIYDLEAPVVKPITGPAVNGVFSVAWNEVPAADVYNVWAYYDRTAEQDGEFVITNEDFSTLKDIDGGAPKFTPENPDPYAETYQGHIRAIETVQAGWMANYYRPYVGVVCLDGWHALIGKKNVTLQCDEIDLSRDGGKFKVSVDFWGVIAEEKNEKAEVIARRQTEAAVALFTYDEELGKFKMAEVFYPAGITPKWSTHVIEFTKGTSRSKIGIFPVKGDANLYVDNLKVTQNFKKGDVFREPCYLKQYIQETTHEVKVNAPADKLQAPLYARVVAVRGKGSQDQYSVGELKKSAFSNYETVQNTVGTETLEALVEANVYAESGVLRVVNPTGAAVTVFAVGGETVYHNAAGEEAIAITDLASGTYVVSVGNEVFKVLL